MCSIMLYLWRNISQAILVMMIYMPRNINEHINTLVLLTFPNQNHNLMKITVTKTVFM